MDTKLPSWVMPGFTNVVPENAPNNFKDKYVLVLPPNPDDPEPSARGGMFTELPAASVGGYGSESRRAHQHWQWTPVENFWNILRNGVTASLPDPDPLPNTDPDGYKAENLRLRQQLQYLEASEARKLQLLTTINQSISQELAESSK